MKNLGLDRIGTLLIDPHNNQFPVNKNVSLIPQLLDHCNSIAYRSGFESHSGLNF